MTLPYEDHPPQERSANDNYILMVLNLQKPTKTYKNILLNFYYTVHTSLISPSSLKGNGLVQ